MLTTTGLSAIAGGSLFGGISYIGYVYPGTSWDMALSCILTGAVGVVAGALGGLFCFLVCMLRRLWISTKF